MKSVRACLNFLSQIYKGVRCRRLTFAAKSSLLISGPRGVSRAKKEMPGYQKLVDNYDPRGFLVIGFKFANMPDTEDPIQFAKKIGAHYPLATATHDLQQKFGGIEGLPTTMLYDRKGMLRMKVVGFEYTKNIEAALKPLL